MTVQSCEFAVIGGGVSGLTTAWYLRKNGCDVRLLERTSTVGGCMRTICQDGFLLEQGPFNVLVRDPVFEELLVDLAADIEVEPAAPDSKIRYLYLGGRLTPLPTGPISLFSSPFLTARGKVRLLAEPICSRRPRNDDPTIADFATRHFGAEFSDNVMGALVTGIFGGDVQQLSLKACFPSVAGIDHNHRSLLLYGLSVPFRRIGKPKKRRRKWRGLVNFVGGLGAVSGALGRQLGDAVHTDCELTRMTRSADGYSIEFAESCDPQQLLAQHLILATPARGAAALLSGIGDERCCALARLLESIVSVPLVVMNLGFRECDVGHDLKGFGFLVPPGQQGMSLLGVLWANSIFPSHAPPGHHLLRLFVGGARRPELTYKSDEELVSLAMDELTDLLQLSRRPVLVNSCRYPAAIPQYYPGHTAKVRSIREHLAAIPNLHLVGNYLEGVSINDCVRLAQRTVNELVGTPTASRVPSSA